MLYVESVTPSRLVVKASNPTDAEVRFDYMVNGIRAGFEGRQPIRDRREFSSNQ